MDTRELRELAKRATPGPWGWDGKVWDYDHEQEAPWLVRSDSADARIVEKVIGGEIECTEANAEYIAALSPDVLEGLCDELDAAKAKEMTDGEYLYKLLAKSVIGKILETPVECEPTGDIRLRLHTIIWQRDEAISERDALRAENERLRDALKIESRPALECAIRWIEKEIAPRKCDSDGVSDCWRCTSVAVARWLAKLMKQIDAALLAESTQPAPDQKGKL
jgi:hypothetical protein